MSSKVKRGGLGAERWPTYGTTGYHAYGKGHTRGRINESPSRGGHSGATGMHSEDARLMPDDLAARLRHTIADAMHNGVLPVAYATSCPLCGKHIRRGVAGGTSFHDPLTGQCTKVNACSKRRAELDDETIEFLGLIPRGKESEGNGPAPQRVEVLQEQEGQARAPAHEIGVGITRRSGVIGQVVARRDRPPSTSR